MTDTTQAVPRFKGQKIELAGQEYVVPALSFGQLRELQPRLAALAKFDGLSEEAITEEAIDTMVDVIHSAISRNYPELPKSFVKECLDLSNMMEVLTAVMGVSGLKKYLPAKEATASP